MPEIIVKLGDNIVHKYVFDKEIMSVGRARDNDIVIENLSVSRNHARVRKEGDRFILTDLNSANGTYVNGVRVTRVEIVNDDVVTIGKHKLHFIDKAPSDEELIGEAFGAERTMLVDRTQSGRLLVSKGKQKDQDFKITKYETYIGRASDNDVRLHDWFVSKKHAVVIRQGMNFFIKDLGSWRGTMVNGKNVRDCELKSGDEIQLGTTVLTFHMEGEGAGPQITGRVPQEIAYEESDAGLAAAGARAQVPEPPDYARADQLDEAELEESEAARAEAFREEMEAAADQELMAGAGRGRRGKEEPVAPRAEAEDEYAPLSEEELMELEEEEREFATPQPVLPATPMEGLGREAEAPLAAEGLEAEEEGFAASLQHEDEEPAPAVPGLEASEAEEWEEEAALAGEEALAKAPEPEVEAAPAAAQAYQPFAPYEELPAREPDSPAAAPAKPAPAAEPADDDEVALWLKALKNKSRVIRREAARKLKHLTGRDYDWESKPE